MGSRRPLFFQIGLVAALAVVAAAFLWGNHEAKRIARYVGDPPDVDPILVSPTEQKSEPVKIKPMEVKSDFIEVMRNDTKIETTEDYFTDFDPDASIPIPAVVEDVVEEIPVFNPDEDPVPYGGDINAFRAWLMGKALQYPRVAIDNNITGTVTIKFVVEKDGALSGFEAIASPDKMLTDEAIRALRSSPRWKPGKQRNRPVRVFYVLPVVFRLDAQ